MVKTQKYRNKWVNVDGIKFQSKAEAKRYKELKLLEASGEITHLRLQPKFILLPAFTKNGVKFRAITYKADFSYCDFAKGGQVVIEDVKGMQTKEFKLKRKIFEHRYPDLTLQIIGGGKK